MTSSEPTISLALRFHVNFYHSYRGDSLDELGIGKDIRIIRSILDDLDELNARGIPVRGTWDIENYYSLETYMPRHAPDLLERIQRRVADGTDEIELMSYNNGIVSAHTSEEFDRAIGWAISNPAGSGLADLFASWAPIVRPQECMFTPSNIAQYKKHGVEVLSLYYSALPFNGFSTMIPPLSAEERYNPLTLHSAETGESMLLLPAYNHGDVADHWASLKRWIRQLRRGQRRDLLLLIDMDADDSFWAGEEIPLVPQLLPSFGGLYKLVRSVASLPYLRFVRPYDYVKTHPAVGEVTISHDTADGSFDGYSSWTEKRSNTKMWSIIHQARITAEAAATVASADDTETQALIDKALTSRVLAMSTTHFGLASPVMNRHRLVDAEQWARQARAEAEAALHRAYAGNRAAREAYAFDPEIDELPPGRGALVTLPPQSAAGAADSSVRRSIFDQTVTQAVINPGSSIWKPTSRESNGARRGKELRIRDGAIINEEMELRPAGSTRSAGGLTLVVKGKPLFSEAFGIPWITYAGKVRRAAGITTDVSRLSGRPDMAELRRSGTVPLRGAEAAWGQLITVVAGLPYLYVDMEITYPETTPHGYDKKKAERLATPWDARWNEVAPFELVPALDSTPAAPVRLWKHNFQNAVSSYQFDRHTFSKNHNIASSNNQITDGWLAVTDGSRGVVLAQSATAETSAAFCPIRVNTSATRQVISLNPFGTYYGAQLRYPTAESGLGRTMALLKADQLDSYAPSYAGTTMRISLMIAPYEGDEPPASLQRDALLFASPGVSTDGNGTITEEER